MRVVALISGGKDSCYNMLQCVSAGHSVVALANLRPHTHGKITLSLLSLLLARDNFQQKLFYTTLYSYTSSENQQNDLTRFPLVLQEKEGVEAVSVGAILSDYQRVRVENVCARLQLQPLAYLWRRDQAELLREIISSDLHAVVIKVAAYGGQLGKTLSKTILDYKSGLWQLSEKYGVHICGEGGEYETFTVDCPLFKKKIIIDSMETVIHSADAFAPVGYLRFTRMHTEYKREVRLSVKSSTHLSFIADVRTSGFLLCSFGKCSLWPEDVWGPNLRK
uniref:Diphthine--ammonia ligase n=1 Tax=Cyprinus carpio TaxID=7962 RepID=A0A8C2HJD4_CYPCA